MKKKGTNKKNLVIITDPTSPFEATIYSKKCGRCGIIKPVTEFNKSKNTASGLRSQCKQCMTEERIRLKQHYSEWRHTPEKKQWYAEYRRGHNDPVKMAARRLASTLRKQPCAVCGEAKVEAHHHDYSKPLDVIWLCRSCHIKHHISTAKKHINPLEVL